MPIIKYKQLLDKNVNNPKQLWAIINLKLCKNVNNENNINEIYKENKEKITITIAWEKK